MRRFRDTAKKPAGNADLPLPDPIKVATVAELEMVTDDSITKNE